MISTVAICEKRTSKECLLQLLNKVHLDKVFTVEECKDICTDTFTVLFFILNIDSIGNEFFLNEIDKILINRKNTKSIYFVIDETSNVSESELFSIKLELEKSLINKIKNPKIILVSLLLARSYYTYNIGIMKLDDIRKDKGVGYIDNDGYSVSGKELNENHISKFWQKSNIQEFIKIINEHIPQFKNVDILKKTWGVLGEHKSGKTTFIEVMNYINENISFIEYSNIEEVKFVSMDGLIILLTLNNEENKKVLEITKRVSNINIVIVINKIDMYTEYDNTKSEIENEISEYIKETTNLELAASISSYYALKALELKSNKIESSDLVRDEDIIILDKYGFPQIYNGDAVGFKKEFMKQSTLNTIKGVDF